MAKRLTVRRSRVPVAMAAVALACGASIGLDFSPGWIVIGAAASLLILGALPTWLLVAAVLAASLLGSLYRVADLSIDNYVVAAVTSVLLVRRAGTRTSTTRTGRLLVAGFVVMGIACVVAAASTGSSEAAGAVRFLSYATVAHHLARMPERARLKLCKAALIIGGVAASSVVVVAMGLPLAPLYVDRESGLLRSGGLVGHPNFAAYAIGWMLLAVIVLPHGKPQSRSARIALVALLATALLATGARLAAIAFVLSLLYGLRHRVQRHTVIAAVLVGVGVASLTTSSMVERFESLANSGGLTGQNSAGWRLEKWANDFALARQYLPWGAGWNQAQAIFEDGLGAHNGYLQVLLELGFIGTVGAALVLVSFVVASRRAPTGSTQLLFFGLTITVGDPGLFYPAILYLALIHLTPPARLPGAATPDRAPRSDVLGSVPQRQRLVTPTRR